MPEISPDQASKTRPHSKEVSTPPKELIQQPQDHQDTSLVESKLKADSLRQAPGNVDSNPQAAKATVKRQSDAARAVTGDASSNQSVPEDVLDLKDYKALAKHGLSDFQTREKAAKALSSGVARKVPGAADALRDQIREDSVYGEYAMDPLVEGLGNDISKDDYQLLLTKVDKLEYGNEGAKKALAEAITDNKGGVREELDKRLSTKLTGEYSERGSIKMALKLQSEGQKDYQPPAALFDNLVKHSEKKPDVARDLMEKAFEASSKPEELGAYAHHLIDDGYLNGRGVEEKVLKASKARLEAGGIEPLEAARKVLARDGGNRGAERRALNVYKLAPEKLAKEDVAVLGDILDKRGQQLGVDGTSAAGVLGEAGKHAQGEKRDAIRGHLRKALDHKDPRVHRSVAEAMGTMADKLKKEDVLALGDHLDIYGAKEAIKKASGSMDGETKKAVLEQMRGKLGQARGPGREAAEVMGGMAADLTPDDVAALKKSAERTRHSNYDTSDDEAMKAALKSAKDPKTRAAAADALLDVHGRKNLDDATVKELAKVAAASGDKELKAKLLSQLKDPPLTEKNLKVLGEAYQKKLQGRIDRAQRSVQNGRHVSRTDQSLNELGQLMAALHMSKDPKSEHASQIDKNKVNQRIQEVMNRSEVRAEFESLRKDAIKETMPHLVERDRTNFYDRVKDPGKAQQDYLLSADFEARMRLASPEEKKLLLGGELGRLAQMDPQKAEGAQKALQTRAKVEAVQESPLEYIKSLPLEEREKALDSMLDAAGMGRRGPALAKHLSTALHRVDAASLRGKDHASVLIKTLESLKGKPGVSDTALNKAIRGIEGLDTRGGFGSALGAFAVGTLLMRGVPRDWNEGLRSGADLLEITSHAGSYSKLIGISDDLLKFGKLAKFTRVAQFLGPVGDMITTPLDAHGAYLDFKSGDYVGGWSKAVGATAGAVSVAAGLAALSPTAGPGMPIVLGVALVVGVGATVVDWIWGKDPTEQMLINLGVAKS